MFKMKLRGNPESKINIRRKRFNSKDLLYRIYVYSWVAVFVLIVHPLYMIYEEIFLNEHNDPKGNEP